MVNDQPSSDDLIRQAKESLQNVAEERVSEIQSSVDDIEKGAAPTRPVDRPATQRNARQPTPQTQANRPAGPPVAKRRVPPNAARTSGSVPPEAGASRSGSGMVLRVVGSAIVLMVGVTWLLLLIGIIDDQSEIGETLGGGAILTLIPLAVGVLFRRAGIRRGTKA